MNTKLPRAIVRNYGGLRVSYRNSLMGRIVFISDTSEEPEFTRGRMIGISEWRVFLKHLSAAAAAREVIKFQPYVETGE